MMTSKGDPIVHFLCGVRLVYCMSPHLNILCISALKRYHIKTNLDFKWWRSILIYVSPKIHNLCRLWRASGQDGIDCCLVIVHQPALLCTNLRGKFFSSLYPWSRSGLLNGLANGDQRQLTGSSGTLEACSWWCSIQMAAFTLLLLFTLLARCPAEWQNRLPFTSPGHLPALLLDVNRTGKLATQ